MQTTNSKYLTCALIAAFTIAVYAPADTNTATAGNTATHVVTVTVSPIRAIYVDEQEEIIAIFSNVPAIADEKLQAFKSGTEIPVGDEIIGQCEKLLPVIDRGKIGLVYQQPNPDPLAPAVTRVQEKAPTRMQLEKSSGKIYIYNETTIETDVSCKKIFDSIRELNSSPSAPHKENYIIRVTITDAEDGLTKVSVEPRPSERRGEYLL